jgi:uncharacterized protein YlxW (UPF0749 family)
MTDEQKEAELKRIEQIKHQKRLESVRRRQFEKYYKIQRELRRRNTLEQSEKKVIGGGLPSGIENIANGTAENSQLIREVGFLLILSMINTLWINLLANGP